MPKITGEQITMLIDITTRVTELTSLLKKIFQLPEVNKVLIRDIEILSLEQSDKIEQAVEECYHDILSDIDLGIHVTLHPEDIKEGRGYQNSSERIGLSRDNYLGLTFTNDGDLYQMYRVIMKNGVRFDIGFYITKDSSAPIYHIAQEVQEEIKEEGKYWPRWDLRKADFFWFTEVHALAKLMRGDYLISDHLANMLINETLVAQMLERDNQYGINFHRYGHREMLDYFSDLQADEQSDYCIEPKDETYQHIANKLKAAAVSYDRLIKRLNPSYEERRGIYFEIWKQYDAGYKYKLMNQSSLWEAENKV